MSLIGNPVKFGDGPAAVTPPFLFYTTRGTLLAWSHTTVQFFRDGKVADRDQGGEVRKPARAEGAASVDKGHVVILRIKKGYPRIDLFWSGFFLSKNIRIRVKA